MNSLFSLLRHRSIDAGRWADEAIAAGNRLSEPQAVRETLQPAGKLIAVLLAAAFLPRLLMAWHLPTICVDGAGYIASAESIVQGDATIPIVYRLNLYPIVLAGLHRLGLGWETAAEAWGVLCSTLVVLPLFGWVRRQFDDATAALACLLYAAHPELIEWSPEAVRDQTFWLLATATIYFSYRAITELRGRHFLAIGITLPLCIFTRFEGVFLLPAVLLWAGARCYALPVGRRRLVLGLAAASLLAPLLLSAGNACLYRRQSLSELLYLEPMKRIGAFFHRLEDGNLDNFGRAETQASRTDVSPFAPVIFMQLSRAVERGYTPLYALLFLLGAWSCGKRLFRSDLLPLVLIGAVTVGGTWIHLWETGGASSRYILPVVIFSLPCTAVGLLRFAALVDACFRTAPLRYRAVPTCLALLTVVGWSDALTTNYGGRELRAEMGRWIRQNYGDRCHLLGIDEQLPIVAFYSEARTTVLAPRLDMETVLQQMADQRPDVVLFSQPPIVREASRFIDAAGRRLGLTRTPPPQDDAAHTGLLVLGRGELQR